MSDADDPPEQRERAREISSFVFGSGNEPAYITLLTSTQMSGKWLVSISLFEIHFPAFKEREIDPKHASQRVVQGFNEQNSSVHKIEEDSRDS